MEVNRNYPDILLVPRDSSKGYKAVMVEFKYLKKGEVAKLEDKQKEAKDEEGNILKEEGLLAVIWPEPFAYEKTQDALKTTQLFPFSEEGKAQVIEWLNASWEEGIYKNETI